MPTKVSLSRERRRIYISYTQSLYLIVNVLHAACICTAIRGQMKNIFVVLLMRISQHLIALRKPAFQQL